MRYRVAALILCTCLATLAIADEQKQRARVEILPGVAQVLAGQSFTVALRFTIDKDWHMYWLNPGDSGLAPSVEWKTPPGVTVSPKLHFPAPHRIKAGDDIESYGYENELVVIADVTTVATVNLPITLNATINWLVCNEVCLAESAKASATIGMPRATIDPRYAAYLEAVAKPVKEDLVKNHRAGVVVSKEKSDGYLYAYVSADSKFDTTGIDLFPPAVEFATFAKPRFETDDAGTKIVVPFRVLPGMTEPVSGEAMLVRTVNGKRVGELIPLKFDFVK
jgi:DsbC/DsbD-like thiol-disulfide interchange protein